MVLRSIDKSWEVSIR